MLGHGWFNNIPQIEFKGPESNDQLSFRHYDPSNFKLLNLFPSALAVWGSVGAQGSTMFARPTFPVHRPWATNPQTLEELAEKVTAQFELAKKLSVPLVNFHTEDLLCPYKNREGFDSNYKVAQQIISVAMKETGVGIGWATPNLFSDPVFALGAVTNPNAEVRAWAQYKAEKALESAKALDAKSFNMWFGGEEAEPSHAMDFELKANCMAEFLEHVVAHAERIGFKGKIMIEPKPHEPVEQNFFHDALSTIGFLMSKCPSQAPGSGRKLIGVNIETGHARMAKHTMTSETWNVLYHRRTIGFDGNFQEPNHGWDVDLPTEATELIGSFRANLETGRYPVCITHDFHDRARDFEPIDMIVSQIFALDQIALALKSALACNADSLLNEWAEERRGMFAVGIPKNPDAITMPDFKSLPSEGQTQMHHRYKRVCESAARKSFEELGFF